MVYVVYIYMYVCIELGIYGVCIYICGLFVCRYILHVKCTYMYVYIYIHNYMIYTYILGIYMIYDVYIYINV